MSGPADGAEVDVVLSDGIGCDGFVWKYLVPDLAARHRVIRWHYRGHGRSGTPPSLERMTMDALIEDLEAVLDAAECDAAVLGGHSMGVQVSLETHRVIPDRCAGLLLICGSYGNPLQTFHGKPWLGQALPAISAAVKRLPTPAMRLWRSLLPSRLPWLTAFLAGEVNRSLIRLEDLQPYFEHLAKMEPEVFWSLLAEVAHHSAIDHLPDVDVPTLVVGAENDTFTPVWLAREMTNRIPDAEFLLIPKGSHAAPIEQPELLSLRIEKFFRDRLGSYDDSALPRRARG